MTWTTNEPTSPGWYWCRRTGCLPVVRHVVGSANMRRGGYDKGFMVWSENGRFFDLDYDEYAGPIPEPEAP